MDKVELRQEEMEDSLEVSWTENSLRSVHVSGCSVVPCTF
jgi:hypothetical protein